MKRILCILITAIWLCTCWAGNGKKPIVWVYRGFHGLETYLYQHGIGAR